MHKYNYNFLSKCCALSKESGQPLKDMFKNAGILCYLWSVIFENTIKCFGKADFQLYFYGCSHQAYNKNIKFKVKNISMFTVTHTSSVMCCICMCTFMVYVI